MNRKSPSNCKITKSKGFFFVLLTLIILMYILSSISLMVSTIEISERQSAENFKISNMESALGQITKEKVERLSFIVTYGALTRLAEYSETHYVKPGNAAIGEWEFKYVNNSLYTLVTDGTANGPNFVDGIEISADRQKSLAGWADELNLSLRKVGLELSTFSVNGFTINQTEVSAVNYSFIIELSVKSKDGDASLTRTYIINSKIPLTGMVDHAIQREGKKKSPSLNIEKQFFFNPDYDTPSKLQPEQAGVGSAGQGWFYGPLVSTTEAKGINEANRSKYILFGSYNDIVGLNNATIHYAQFGAYILTNSPKLIDSCGSEAETFNIIYYSSSSGSCTPDQRASGNEIEKPFVVMDGFKKDNLPKSTDCPDGKCVLFNAKYNYDSVQTDVMKKKNSALVYGIENLRDFAMCGYYTNSDKAASYLQRFFNDSYQRNSTLGIETFLIGDFIGGSDAAKKVWDDKSSRLDRELFNNAAGGEYIRGMPGCKNMEMCSYDSPIGHFALASEGRSNYIGANDISCINGMAKCD